MFNDLSQIYYWRKNAQKHILYENIYITYKQSESKHHSGCVRKDGDN